MIHLIKELDKGRERRWMKMSWMDKVHSLDHYPFEKEISGLLPVQKGQKVE